MRNVAERRQWAAAVLVAVGASGSVAPAAAQWVEEPGAGWAALAVYHQNTRHEFRSNGDERPIFPNGQAITTSTFLTVALGLTRGLDVWVQPSFHHLQFDDVTADRSSTGFGDTRLWLRAAPLKWVGSDFPLAIRGGVKLPFGDFDVDAEIIPLGDGQRDWEVMAEVGHSFWPRSVYVMGWLGYRWREENTESLRDFGDEIFYFAQVGGQVGQLGYKIALDGWDGRSGVVEGLAIPSFQRDLIQLQPTVSYPAGPGSIEAGARFALKGKNLPAGTAFLLQYFARLGLF